jgi:hypothetical protein
MLGGGGHAQQHCCFAAGPRWAWRAGHDRTEIGRAFGLGPNRKEGFSLFFEFIFNVKTIPEKSRNSLKARKIL